MNRTSSLTLLSSLALAPWVPFAAFAQATPPNAGQLLQQIGPAPQAPAPRAPSTTIEERAVAPLHDGARMTVKGFHITGATAFSESELQALVADAAGKDLNLGDLDALAARITRRYRDAGYLVARAYLPAQDIQDGVVTIAVLEGRIGRVEVTNPAGVAGSALAPLNALVPGEIVSDRAIEKSLLAITDLPGVEVKSTLRPGTAVGTSDFLVDVAPGPALTGSADFDSFGNRYTGTYRVGASVNWNNPARLGDQLSLRAQTSDGHFAYGRVGYQLPVGERATRIGAAWSQMHYKLGENFASLQADGDADIGSLYLLQPIVRSRDKNWYGQVQYDDKHMVDRVAAKATETDKRLANWTVGVNGDFLDGLGGGSRNTVALSLVAGHVTLDATSAAIDGATAQSEGSFTKWSASYQRTQRLTERTSLFLSYSGQWASKNLDSSEKFMLGGVYGVRAYPQGEASGDEGQLLSLELHAPVAERWEAQAFVDAGWITTNRHPWTTGTNDRHLAGYGLGAIYAGGGYTLRAFVAWKAGTGQPTSDVDRRPRVWVQGATYF